MSDKVRLGLLATGVPGLDVLLSGGLTEYSFTLIAGAPGSSSGVGLVMTSRLSTSSRDSLMPMRARGLRVRNG